MKPEVNSKQTISQWIKMLDHRHPLYQIANKIRLIRSLSQT
ncbi:hypothetical protein [Leptospira noguchii]|nr:hypothetical protein [Leptospira noguchii]